MLATRITIGELDRRIKIQRPVITDGTAGSDIINSWSDVVTVWCSIKERIGNESIEADRLTYNELTIFTIRYREGINVQMRIILGSVIYQIVSVTNSYDRNRGAERKGFLELAAEIVDNVIVDSGFTTGFTEGYR